MTIYPEIYMANQRTGFQTWLHELPSTFFAIHRYTIHKYKITATYTALRTISPTNLSSSSTEHNTYLYRI
jgi:hypothetical protein